MALTGARIGAADAILAGFADRYVAADALPELVEALCDTGDAALVAAMSRDSSTIEEPEVAPYLASIRAGVDAAFDGSTPMGIVEALQADPAPWSQDAAKAILRGCPSRSPAP